KVVTRRLLVLGVLKRSVPIQGERRLVNRSVGVAIISISLRVVFATAPAPGASRLPNLFEMKRVAATGSDTWVRVPKMATVIARSDTWPICERSRTLKRRT